jgi:hypothetical protein
MLAQCLIAVLLVLPSVYTDSKHRVQVRKTAEGVELVVGDLSLHGTGVWYDRMNQTVTVTGKPSSLATASRRDGAAAITGGTITVDLPTGRMTVSGLPR